MAIIIVLLCLCILLIFLCKGKIFNKNEKSLRLNAAELQLAMKRAAKQANAHDRPNFVPAQTVSVGDDINLSANRGGYDNAENIDDNNDQNNNINHDAHNDIGEVDIIYNDDVKDNDNISNEENDSNAESIEHMYDDVNVDNTRINIGTKPVANDTHTSESRSEEVNTLVADIDDRGEGEPIQQQT